MSLLEGIYRLLKSKPMLFPLLRAVESWRHDLAIFDYLRKFTLVSGDNCVVNDQFC